ncbi:hypothetical protein ABH931_005832 [Streptacidiphilus sp. MAP12-33]|uniref:hypothetical protein n=1 Tax=Streptacidiphilus sp. MAP12-33 TaxID=3156266 RepID=UPI003512A5B3
MSDTPRRDLNPNDPSNLPSLSDADLHIPDYPVMVPEPAPGGAVIRVVEYPGELNPRGTLVVCTSCRANRDWLLLETRRRVFVRCRCGFEWEEGELDFDFFEANFSYADRSWGDAEQALTDLGFGGEFAGIYFN